MNAKKLYFRNGITPANISAVDSQIRLFGATGNPLGQLSSAPEKSCLLATDEAHSILGAKSPLGFQAAQYSAYGHSASEKQATALGYNGELLASFDFYLLGHGNRAYSTRLMRFLSPDKIGVFSGTNFNAYTYTAGDPINRNDPSGNMWKYIKSKFPGHDPIATQEKTQYKKNLSSKKTIEKIIADTPEFLKSHDENIKKQMTIIKGLGHQTNPRHSFTFATNERTGRRLLFSHDTDLNNDLQNMYFRRQDLDIVRSAAESLTTSEFRKSQADFINVFRQAELVKLNDKIRQYERQHPVDK